MNERINDVVFEKSPNTQATKQSIKETNEQIELNQYVNEWTLFFSFEESNVLCTF